MASAGRPGNDVRADDGRRGPDRAGSGSGSGSLPSPPPRHVGGGPVGNGGSKSPCGLKFSLASLGISWGFYQVHRLSVTAPNGPLAATLSPEPAPSPARAGHGQASRSGLATQSPLEKAGGPGRAPSMLRWGSRAKGQLSSQPLRSRGDHQLLPPAPPSSSSLRLLPPPPPA